MQIDLFCFRVWAQHSRSSQVENIGLPLRFRKAGRAWYGGARETHWATSHNRVTPSNTKEFSKSSRFFRSSWYRLNSVFWILLCELSFLLHLKVFSSFIFARYGKYSETNLYYEKWWIKESEFWEKSTWAICSHASFLATWIGLVSLKFSSMWLGNIKITISDMIQIFFNP